MAGSPTNPSPSRGFWFAIDARLTLPLGLLVLGLCAWLVSGFGVAGGLVAGVPILLLGPRSRSFSRPVYRVIAAATVAGLVAALLLGTGASVARALLGSLAGLITGIILAMGTMIRWLRARTRPGPSA